MNEEDQFVRMSQMKMWKLFSVFFSICSYTDWYHAFLYFPLQKYVSLFRCVKRFYPHNSLCRMEITMEELLLYLFIFLCLTKSPNFQIPASSSVWKQFLCSHTLPHAFIFHVVVLRDFFCFNLPSSSNCIFNRGRAQQMNAHCITFTVYNAC